MQGQLNPSDFYKSRLPVNFCSTVCSVLLPSKVAVPGTMRHGFHAVTVPLQIYLSFSFASIFTWHLSVQIVLSSVILTYHTNQSVDRSSNTVYQTGQIRMPSPDPPVILGLMFRIWVSLGLDFACFKNILHYFKPLYMGESCLCATF